jgi:signal transduction histidine kinase
MAASEHHPARAVERGPVPVESVDARMLMLMRCALAFSALAIIYIDPSEPTRLVELTYLSLSAYCAYSVALALWSHHRGWPAAPRVLHWLDVLLFSGLIGLTEGTSSIFFYFFFFPVLVASFCVGYREGILVTMVSGVSFISVGLLTGPVGTEFELNRTLIRPVYLLTLGYMIAYWGGYEQVLKRRLLLLKEVNNAWSPRFGVHHLIGTNLNRLLGLYEKSSALLLVERAGGGGRFLMYRASRNDGDRTMVPDEVTEGAAHLLAILPERAGVAFSARRNGFLPGGLCEGYDFDGRARIEVPVDQCEAIANLIECRAFITVPYSQRDGARGRLYLSFADEPFRPADLDFLFQFSASLSSVVENMQLMDELVSRAAEHERYKISRDLHDTTIQPYIGLKLALEALQREAGPEGPVSRRISELAEMASMTIRDLRDYASSLKEATSVAAEHLASAIREQAERYKRFYGIDVEVAAHLNAGLTDRLAAAAFQIVSEGLSNVLRHTTAKRAYVGVLCEVDFLLLQVGNERDGDAASAPRFTPRSIFERAAALGGAAFIEETADGYTVVRVSLPM